MGFWPLTVAGWNLWPYERSPREWSDGKVIVDVLRGGSGRPSDEGETQT